MRKATSGISVFQRTDGDPKSWVLGYQVEPGKWKQHRLQGAFLTQAAAERAGRTWLAKERAEGRSQTTKTIRDLAADWLKLRAASPNLAMATVRDNESHLENHILKKFGDLPIGKLSVPVIREWVRELREGRSPITTRNIVSTLSAFYDDARAEQWVTAHSNIVRDPGVKKELPAVDANAEVVTMPIAAAQALIFGQMIPEHRRIRYILAFTSGLRDGELAGLTWADVDLDASPPTLQVDRAFALRAEADSYASISDTKTDKSVRTVPLHRAAVAALRWWKAEGWEIWVGRQPKANDPILASSNGNHWRPKSAKEIKSDLEAVGHSSASTKDNPIDFHATRRCFSTWLQDAGVDEATVGKLFGHAGRSTAARHYTAAVLDHLHRAVEHIQLRWALDGNAPASSLAASSTPPESAQCEPCAAANDEGDEDDLSNEEHSVSHLSSAVEQRFRNSSAGRQKTAKRARRAQASGVVVANDDGPPDEYAQLEERARVFALPRELPMWRQRAIACGERSAELARVLDEACHLALHERTNDETPAKVRLRLERVVELLKEDAAPLPRARRRA